MTEIYVITHKIAKMVQEENYIPLMVGAVNKDSIPEIYLRDDVGENISEKNESYCELTGLYWIWKHSTADIIGLVHYRRYFIRLKGIYLLDRAVVSDKKHCRVLQNSDVEKLVSDYDMIVKKSRKLVFGRNIDSFRGVINFEVYENVCEVLHDYENGRYYEPFITYMKEKSHINANMFIGKKKIIDQYCDFLFDILDGVDTLHERRLGQRYHERELGYVGEMLFGMWLDMHQIKYVVCPTIKTDSASYEPGGIMTITELFKFLPQILGNVLFLAKKKMSGILLGNKRSKG